MGDGWSKFGKAGAEEAEKVVKKVGAEEEESEDDDDGGYGMRGREPGEPDGEEVFTEAENPVAKGFGDGVNGGAGGGFGAVGGEGHSAGEERGGPAPFGADGGRGSVGDEGGGGRANEGVEGVPEGVEVGDFVSKKFDEVESDGYAENDRVGENFES